MGGIYLLLGAQNVRRDGSDAAVIDPDAQATLDIWGIGVGKDPTQRTVDWSERAWDSSQPRH